MNNIARIAETRDGKGLGVFALRDFEAGDLLWQEAPLLIVPAAQDELTFFEDAVAGKVDEATLAASCNLAALDAGELAKCDPKSPLFPVRVAVEAAERLGLHPAVSNLLRVLPSSSFGDDGASVLYRLSCRLNHSCCPNAAFFGAVQDSLRVSAVRPIKAGEEITASYLSSLGWASTWARRRTLERCRLFICCCPRCSSSPVASNSIPQDKCGGNGSGEGGSDGCGGSGGRSGEDLACAVRCRQTGCGGAVFLSGAVPPEAPLPGAPPPALGVPLPACRRCRVPLDAVTRADLERRQRAVEKEVLEQEARLDRRQRLPPGHPWATLWRCNEELGPDHWTTIFAGLAAVELCLSAAIASSNNNSGGNEGGGSSTARTSSGIGHVAVAASGAAARADNGGGGSVMKANGVPQSLMEAGPDGMAARRRVLGLFCTAWDFGERIRPSASLSPEARLWGPVMSLVALAHHDKVDRFRGCVGRVLEWLRTFKPETAVHFAEAAAAGARGDRGGLWGQDVDEVFTAGVPQTQTGEGKGMV